MEETRSSFPLFNRLVVLISSSAILVAMFWMFARAMMAGRLDVASGFLLVVFVVAACWGIWVSLKWPTRQLDVRDIELIVDRVTLPDNAIICQFFTGLRTGAVVIEPTSAVIHFEYCHVPNQFLAVAQPTFRCSLSDLQDYFICQAHGASLTIRTATGKVVIPDHATNFDQLLAFIKQTISVRTTVLGVDHPLVGFVHLAGALMGLFGGVYVTPRNANDRVLGLFVIGGAFLGVVASWLLVALAERCWKIGIASLIGRSQLKRASGPGPSGRGQR